MLHISPPNRSVIAPVLIVYRMMPFWMYLETPSRPVLL